MTPDRAETPGRKIAEVRLSTGRLYLNVMGVAVAMEGDPCREIKVRDNRWTEQNLQQAADLINESAARVAPAAVPARCQADHIDAFKRAAERLSLQQQLQAIGELAILPHLPELSLPDPPAVGSGLVSSWPLCLLGQDGPAYA